MGRACPDEAEIVRHIGPPLHESFAFLLATDDPARIAAAIGSYRERFSSTGMFENAVYPEIPQSLEALRELGAILFVATSKPRVFAERIINHFRLGQHFKGIYGSELDGDRSDKRELIAHIVKAESLSPRSTIMIGDRSHDVLGAKWNGVASIGALWGYGSREELSNAGATALCERPGGLSSILRSL